MGGWGGSKFGPNAISFDQNAWSAINGTITEATFLDVFLDGLILRARLEPQGRNTKLFCLL